MSYTPPWHANAQGCVAQAGSFGSVGSAFAGAVAPIATNPAIAATTADRTTREEFADIGSSQHTIGIRFVALARTPMAQDTTRSDGAR